MREEIEALEDHSHFATYRIDGFGASVQDLTLDDDLAFRQVLRVLLECDGVQADIAEDGERATSMLRARPYSACPADVWLAPLTPLMLSRSTEM